jgi:hypothetical protein
MPDINLELGDAIELADSRAAFVGHNRHNIDQLCTDLHRFVFLLGLSDGEQLFGEPTP